MQKYFSSQYVDSKYLYNALKGDYAGGFAVPSLPAIMVVNIQHNKLSERNVMSSTSPCLRFFGSQDKGIRAPADRMCF